MSEINETEFIYVPEFLRFEQFTAVPTAACTGCQSYCELCLDLCMTMCQNCLGTSCLSTCQNCQGSCLNCQGSACLSTCQNCLNAPVCQSGQSCVDCQGIGCQSCQDCQSCQCSTQSGQGSAPNTTGSITNVSATNFSITLTFTSIQNATSYEVHYRKASEVSTVIAGETSTLSYTISGLPPNTEYVVNYRGKNAFGIGPFGTGVTARTKSSIKQWSWTASNGSASSAQTVAAYRAIMNEGASNDFSYKVWNDLVSKINEVVVAIGASWDSSFATLSGSKLGGTGQILTAAKYNAARFNVGCHYSTGIAEVFRGDEFTWSYIYNLATTLNQWIASLS